MNSNTKRETLGSRLGFIFLSAGCAIGLGNVWRFPFITGQYGGAAFVLIYILFLIMFVLPIMIMEFATGRASSASSTRSFMKLRPEHKIWSLWGYIAWLGNYVLMMFYTTITGWMLAYTFYSAMGKFEGITTEAGGKFFDSFLASPNQLVFWMALAVLIGFLVCWSSLRGGVERITKIMMACLLAIMIAIAIRAITLEGADKGLEFYLKPDFSKLTSSGLGTALYAALGQAFFTLSVGMGSMAIFGSYISRDRSLTGEAVIVTALDTFVALTAGLIIFPACFAYGINPGAGPGLLFVTLPNMFSFMPAGRLWGTLFFLFMSFAALSTVVAVFENIIAGYIDWLGWSRHKASLVTSISIMILSVPCALGFNVWSFIQPLGAGTGVLDLEDFIVSDNILPIGSVIYLLFCVTRYGWGWDNFVKEADSGNGLKFPKALRWYFTFVVPVVMLGIIFMGYYSKFGK